MPFHIIGLSYYGYWHGTLANLQGAVTTLSSRFNKGAIVVETSCSFTLADNPNAHWVNVITSTTQLVKNCPATPAGQAANFRAVQDVVASAPGGRGLGAVYWEPGWRSVSEAFAVSGNVLEFMTPELVALPRQP
ncbi:glycosyl hydrolase 53 family protein [Arthrobacter oryzae]|uniref:glycosyl hydrolase 53 family protein n=1 Tax=Arthrobacter oryzae TaxID=409290 RepID=UPI00273C3193|nr:glycosyl hydrolase 53 family protein [Arthrobacter oryzae]WLQ05894.1 glycosyl hydrolase 53 family protein [Arthrobacter oryzae]